MKLLYHYTFLQNLYNIVKPNGLIWLARYYKYFNEKDYEWIRNEAQPIVLEICKEHNWSFDPDLQMLRPYIISFCKSPNSEYMWKYFGNDNHGVNLVISEDVLRKEATLLSENPSIIILGEYIKAKWTRTELKKSILKIAESKLLHNCHDEDRMLFATIGLLRNHYWRQKEIRYITIEKNFAKVEYNNGEITLIPYEVPKSEYDKFISFPKDLLHRVILGKETSQRDFENASIYLANCGYPPSVIRKQK